MKTFNMSNPQNGCEKPTKTSIFVEQIIDSAIVGGISAISAYVAAGIEASFKGAVIGFLLAFLIKLKEYRNL